MIHSALIVALPACFGLILFSLFFIYFFSFLLRISTIILFYFLSSELSRAHKLANITECIEDSHRVVLHNHLLFFFVSIMYDEDVEYTSCGHIFEIKINILFFSFSTNFFLFFIAPQWVLKIEKR